MPTIFNLELAWNKPAKNWKESSEHILRVRINSSSDRQYGLPLRMAIAVDTSSSMQGSKILAAKEACQAVVALLRETDSLELASFSSQVQPLLKSLAGGKGAVDSANIAITKLQASGVTRTDMALEWIQKALPEEKGVVRVGILITDGHATDSQGNPLTDVTPLLEQAGKLSDVGISLYTVGLGNAANFNTAFLSDLSEHGRGAFMYAETPTELEPQIKERLTASQAVAIDNAQLLLTSQAGIKAEGFCRFKPDYLPLEKTSDGSILLGVIRTDTPTDVLIKIEILAGDGQPPFSQEVLQVQLTASALPNPVTATTSILYTNSYSQYEEINSDVETDRLNWNCNIIMEDLIHLAYNPSADPKQVREVLEKLENNAAVINRDDLLEHINQQRSNLEKEGKLDPRRTTRMLIDAKKS